MYFMYLSEEQGWGSLLLQGCDKENEPRNVEPKPQGSAERLGWFPDSWKEAFASGQNHSALIFALVPPSLRPVTQASRFCPLPRKLASRLTGRQTLANSPSLSINCSVVFEGQEFT